MTVLVGAVALLWLIVIVDTAMLVAILRHMGSRNGAEEVGPDEGTVAPLDQLTNIDNEPLPLVAEGDSHNRLFFLTTSCVVCRHMLVALREERGDVFDQSDVFIIRGERERVKSMVVEFHLEPRKVVPDVDGSIFKAWRVRLAPFMVTVDGNRIIVQTGRPEAREQLRELLTVP